MDLESGRKYLFRIKWGNGVSWYIDRCIIKEGIPYLYTPHHGKFDARKENILNIWRVPTELYDILEEL